MIHLEKVNAKNIWEIIELEVGEAQKKFVAPNSISIAQAYTAIDTGCSAFPFGIYDDKTPVGFLMVGFNEAAMYEIWEEIAPEMLKNTYVLWRLMIDEKYQKKGYGRKAIKLALEFIQTWPCGKAEYCALFFEPENEVAKKLYTSLGFVENGERDGNEVLALLKL